MIPRWRNRDLYFNPGSRLRISTGGPFWIWIRWGWKAERQFSIRRFWALSWYRGKVSTHIELGPFAYTHYKV